MNDCPTKAFTRVSNGCYFFQNQTGTTWENAKEACKGMITSNNNSTESSVSHLLIIDTLGEAIALSFWFKGNNYNKTYWIGGYFDTENSLWKWEWNGLPYVKNSYISENNIGTNPKMYLEFNERGRERLIGTYISVIIKVIGLIRELWICLWRIWHNC